MDIVKELTEEIFAPYQEDPVPIDQWLQKSGQILFSPGRGVLMFHDRTMPFQNGKKSTHIWLCGVVSEFRNIGVARVLMRSMLSRKCQSVISAHVNRKKFPEMVACLEHLGFKSESPLSKNLERFEIDTDVLRKRLNGF